MPVLNQIAFFQNRRDEAPNQELARELTQANDIEGIREIAENLRNKNPNIQSDCIKVLYEIGCIEPALIAGYVNDFLGLLGSKNNRLVWGAMIALSTIAGLKSAEISARLGEIMRAMEGGSVITIDNGVKILTAVALGSAESAQTVLPYLFNHLATCRAKDIPQHAEKILEAVSADSKQAFIVILQNRMEELSAPQAARVRKVIRAAEKR
jgi:hypothetical protein